MSNAIRSEIEAMVAAGSDINDIMATLTKTVNEVKEAEENKRRVEAEENKRRVEAEARLKVEREIDEYFDIIADAMEEIAKRKYPDNESSREAVTQCFSKEALKTMLESFDNIKNKFDSIFEVKEPKIKVTSMSEDDVDKTIRDFLEQMFG